MKHSYRVVLCMYLSARHVADALQHSRKSLLWPFLGCCLLKVKAEVDVWRRPAKKRDSCARGQTRCSSVLLTDLFVLREFSSGANDEEPLLSNSTSPVDGWKMSHALSYFQFFLIRCQKQPSDVSRWIIQDCRHIPLRLCCRYESNHSGNIGWCLQVQLQRWRTDFTESGQNQHLNLTELRKLPRGPEQKLKLVLLGLVGSEQQTGPQTGQWWWNNLETLRWEENTWNAPWFSPSHMTTSLPPGTARGRFKSSLW